MLSEDCQTTTGPARNIPFTGINIKSFFDQKPKQVIIVGSDEIQHTLSQLRKTIVNKDRPIFAKSALMQDFDRVFENGYKTYLNRLPKSHIEVRHPIVESKLPNPQDNIFFHIKLRREQMLEPEDSGSDFTDDTYSQDNKISERSTATGVSNDIFSNLEEDMKEFYSI